MAERLLASMCLLDEELARAVQPFTEESAVSDDIKERAKEAGQRAGVLAMASAILDETRAAERERCAKLAEKFYADTGWHDYYRMAGQAIGAAIRDSDSSTLTKGER